MKVKTGNVVHINRFTGKSHLIVDPVNNNNKHHKRHTNIRDLSLNILVIKECAEGKMEQVK